MGNWNNAKIVEVRFTLYSTIHVLIKSTIFGMADPSTTLNSPCTPALPSASPVIRKYSGKLIVVSPSSGRFSDPAGTGLSDNTENVARTANVNNSSQHIRVAMQPDAEQAQYGSPSRRDQAQSGSPSTRVDQAQNGSPSARVDRVQYGVASTRVDRIDEEPRSPGQEKIPVVARAIPAAIEELAAPGPKDEISVPMGDNVSR